MSADVRHAFTIDLEEWFCPHYLRPVAPYETWDSLESRIERSTEFALALLDKHRVQATFFVLGWVGERHPELVRTIVAAGHEVATHGYAHQLLTALTPAAFEADVRRSLEVLEDIVPEPVLGYRAPAFSVTRRTWWALDLLQRCGLRYDSSVYPFALHPDYGVARSPLHPHRHANGLVEAPLSCASYGPSRIPCGGGAYFRLMPYRLYRALAERCIEQERPLVFYIHPWEWDSGVPRVAAGRLTRVRQHANAATVKRKLDALLGDLPFTSLKAVLAQQGLSPA